VLNHSRSKRLFTLSNNHLTSQFVAFGEDPIAAPAAKAARRRRQCETIARIVEAELRPDSPFLIVGDMNDTPDSEALQPLLQAPLGLVDALTDPQETRPAKIDTPAPPTKGLDTPLQGIRPTCHLRAVRSDLAEPGAAGQPERILGRSPHQNTPVTAVITTPPGSSLTCNQCD